MTISVNARALAGLPSLLDRRAEELDSCAGYLRIEAVIADLGAAAATDPLRQAHQRMVTAAQSACAGHADVLRNRADGVRAALRNYATSDGLSAGALHTAAAGSTGMPREHALSADHGQFSGVADQRLGPEIFDSGWLVAEQLRFPPNADTEYPSDPEWTGPLSPSHAQRWLLDRLDDFGGIAARFSHWADSRDDRSVSALAGDWRGCYTSAYAFASFADALHAVEEDLRATAHRVGRVWTGPAATDCATRLLGDADGVDGIGYPMIQLATVYRSAAAAAHEAATALAALRGALADQAGPAIGLGAGILTVGPLVEIGTAAEQRLAHARAVSSNAAHITDGIAAGLMQSR
jgi:hypothetical protein